MATKIRIETLPANGAASLGSAEGAVLRAAPSSTTTVKEILPTQPAGTPIGNVGYFVVWGT